jgi:hypothetical protein
MKLYRYRGANVNTFGEIAEQMAWYSRYDELNDPFEGLYINHSGDGALDELIRQFRVCCFSLRNDDLLLWAHYAENHRGVCLEYEVSEDDFRGQLFPIKYSKVPPTLNRIARRPDGTLSINIEREGAIFLTKSEDWAYEVEFRLIRFSKYPYAKGEKSQIPGRLSAVYFGIRTDPSVVATVNQLLSTRDDVQIQQTALLSDQYTLTFTDVARIK